MGFSGSSVVKNHLPMQETQEMWICSPGREDPLEKEMAAHSSILAWRIPWTEEPGGPQSTGSQSQTWAPSPSLISLCLLHTLLLNLPRSHTRPPGAYP